jgi:hypothetical protein
VIGAGKIGGSVAQLLAATGDDHVTLRIAPQRFSPAATATTAFAPTMAFFQSTGSLPSFRRSNSRRKSSGAAFTPAAPVRSQNFLFRSAPGRYAA